MLADNTASHKGPGDPPIPIIWQRRVGVKTLAAKLQSDNYDAVASHTIVHAGFYMIRDGRGELLSSGAVWLDEPVASREKGIDKLQDLIVANMNRAPGGPNVSRPAADHGLKAVRRPHD